MSDFFHSETDTKHIRWADELKRNLPNVFCLPGDLGERDYLNKTQADVVVVGVSGFSAENIALGPGIDQITQAYGLDFSEHALRSGFAGKSGTLHDIELPKPLSSETQVPWEGLPVRVVLLGLGEQKLSDYRKAGAKLATAIKGGKNILLDALSVAGTGDVQSFVEGFVLRSGQVLHAPQEAGTTKKNDVKQLMILRSASLYPGSNEAVNIAKQIAAACWLARDLAMVPANVKNPQWLVEVCQTLANDNGLELQIFDSAELQKQSFNGILAVGGASVQDAKMVTVSYEPIDFGAGTKSDLRHVVLVGKGITYDTGGISLKPREAMVPMKTDMAGAGAVLATVLAAKALALDLKVTAVLPLAENAMGAQSYRPGDVITAYGGKSIEIRNTDAEGRLVLADALLYAQESFRPDLLIDVATLTGAATLGLGKIHAALYSNNEAVAEQLLEAGQNSGEKAWRLPLAPEYRVMLESQVADISHVETGHDGLHGAGSITAALFLAEFIKPETNWVHLDIAGVGRALSDRDENTSPVTGYGPRLLSYFLANWQHK